MADQGNNPEVTPQEQAPQAVEPSGNEIEGLDGFQPTDEVTVETPDAGAELDEAVGFDESRISPEMRPQFEALKAELSKGYKAAFTKKTQGLKDKERDMLATAAENMHKSQLFDQVVNMPEVQDVLQSMRNGQAGQAPPDPQMGGGGEIPPVHPQVQAQLNQIQQQQRAQEAQRAMTAFKARYPKWESQQDGMRAQLMEAKKNGLVIDPALAYKAAVYDKWEASQAARGRQTRAANAATERPTATPPTQAPTGEFASARDAVLASIKELGLDDPVGER